MIAIETLFGSERSPQFAVYALLARRRWYRDRFPRDEQAWVRVAIVRADDESEAMRIATRLKKWPADAIRAKAVLAEPSALERGGAA